MDFNKLITILLFILLVLVCSLIIYSVFKIDESFKLENFQTESVDQKCLSKGCKFFKNKYWGDFPEKLLEKINTYPINLDCNNEEDCKKEFCSDSNIVAFEYSNETNTASKYKLREGVKLEDLDDSLFDQEKIFTQKENYTVGMCLEKFKSTNDDDDYIMEKLNDDNFNSRIKTLKKVYTQLLMCLTNSSLSCDNTDTNDKCEKVEQDKLNLLNVINKIENKLEIMTFIRKSCAVVKNLEERDISFFINFKNPNLNVKTYILSLVKIQNIKNDNNNEWKWQCDNNPGQSNRIVNKKSFLFSIYYYNGELNIEYMDIVSNKFKTITFKLSLISNQKYFIRIEKEENKYIINFTGDKKTIQVNDSLNGELFSITWRYRKYNGIILILEISQM